MAGSQYYESDHSYTDSARGIDLVHNPKHHSKSKHIE
jgi:hypothetical protein